MQRHWQWNDETELDEEAGNLIAYYGIYWRRLRIHFHNNC